MMEIPDDCDLLLAWDGDETCDVLATPVGGLCESSWDCGVPEFEDFCFDDDELYRAFLKARRHQLKRDWRREDLVEALRGLFGRGAFILSELPGVIRVSAGRALNENEKAMLHLFRVVLPVAPGIRVEVNGQVEDVPFFGFGAGWGGPCESVWAGATGGGR